MERLPGRLRWKRQEKRKRQLSLIRHHCYMLEAAVNNAYALDQAERDVLTAAIGQIRRHADPSPRE